MDTRQIAEAFSSHRFAEVYPHLAPDVTWVVPGQDSIAGREAVIATCEASGAEFAGMEQVEFSRFLSIPGPDAAAVDAVARYVSDGSVSVVSSADIYEFNADGQVTTITSYAVELES